MAQNKVLICPYCGDTQSANDRCRACGGLFEQLSRQATHNAMGPWFIRDERRPFQPGCSYETLLRLLERGQVNKYTIIRGPTTKQFWTVAKRVPGVSHLLGYCHNCDASVDPEDHGCHACGVPFGAYLDRNFLGLPEIKPLPWEVGGQEAALQSSTSRMMDFRRAAEPLGISSFASDEELRAQGVTPMAGYGQPFSGPENVGSALPPTLAASRHSSFGSAGAMFTAPTEASAHVVSAVSVLQESAAPTAITARALQRRLERQQNTIRMLVIGIFVLAAIALISVFVIASRSTSPALPGNGSSAAPAGPEFDQRQDEQSAPNGDRSNDQALGSADDQTSQPATPLSMEVPSSTLTAAQEADLASALQLLEQAGKSDQPRPERIKIYEEAIPILKNLQTSAPAGSLPADLEETIAAAERELERLKLQEFFP